MKNLNILQRLKPGVSRGTLLLVGGCAWGVSGLLLLYKGGGLANAAGEKVGLTVGGGLLGIAFFLILFRHITVRAINRIASRPENHPCVFSFLDWRGYGMMSIMITGGILLRESGLVPATVMGPSYIMMGTALVLGAPGFFGRRFGGNL